MRSRKFIAYTLGIISAALLLMFAMKNHEDQSIAPLSEQPATPHQVVFGPGGMPQNSTTPSVPNVTVPENKALSDSGQLFTTEDQDLIVNPGLFNILNSYLLPSPDHVQVEALCAFLKRKLPLKSFNQATIIIQHYQRYLIEHDALLEAQGLQVNGVALTSLDLNRIANWQQQRLRLRERLLGDEVTKAWYQNDDANLQQVIDDLRQARITQNTISDQTIDKTMEGENAKVMRELLAKACQHLTTWSSPR